MLTSFKPSPSFCELSAAGENEFPSFSTGNGCPGPISAAENRLQLLSSTGNGCPGPISAAENRLQLLSTTEDKEWSDDFEFTFIVKNSHKNSDATSQQFHPVHPLFNHDFLAGDLPEKEAAEAMRIPLRELLINDSLSRKPTSLEKIEHIVPANFCGSEVQSVPPSPNRWKSLSTGPAWRRWGLRDLVFCRSCSDGKEKFGYVAAKETKALKCSPGREAAKRGLDIVTAHRLYYSKNGGGMQRSFLPYKRNLVGFFTGGQRHRP